MNLLNIIKRHGKGATVSVEEAFLIISEYVFDVIGEYPKNVTFQNGNNKHMQQISHALSVAVNYFDENRANLGLAIVRVREVKK